MWTQKTRKLKNTDTLVWHEYDDDEWMNELNEWCPKHNDGQVFISNEWWFHYLSVWRRTFFSNFSSSLSLSLFLSNSGTKTSFGKSNFFFVFMMMIVTSRHHHHQKDHHYHQQKKKKIGFTRLFFRFSDSKYKTRTFCCCFVIRDSQFFSFTFAYSLFSDCQPIIIIIIRVW